MKITKKDLENMVKRLNAENGFEIPDYSTLGAFRLYKDANGYAIHKVHNEMGGVSTVGHCYAMTVKECYYFLTGLLARV